MSQTEIYSALDEIVNHTQAEQLKTWERVRSEEEISNLLGRRAALLDNFFDEELDELAA